MAKFTVDLPNLKMVIFHSKLLVYQRVNHHRTAAPGASHRRRPSHDDRAKCAPGAASQAAFFQDIVGADGSSGTQSVDICDVL